MSKADDELFGLKSSRTGEYLHSESADEMFEKLGYKKDIIFCNSEVDTITYTRDKNYSSNVDFNCIGETVKVHYGKEKKDGQITMNILKAINLKCRELGWIGEEDE